MPSYALFGGRLESDLTLDGLEPGAVQSPTWRLEVRDTLPPSRVSTILGRAHVDEGVSVRLCRSSAGYRLEYGDTGVFDISAHGRSIVWYRPANADHDNARLDLLGRVMAVALHAAGDFCLHASAVLTPEGVIGFLAPKFHGKSTLAMALVHAGCRALTDDILPIGFADEGVFARPGVPRLRLWSDSARRLAPDRVEGHVGGKHTMDHLPATRESEATFPLAALYLLAPRRPGSAHAVVTRHEVSAVQSALSLVGQAKTGQLLGGDEAPVLLRRAVCVASEVPMYRLEIVRDYERIAEAAGAIVAWHRSRRGAAAASA